MFSQETEQVYAGIYDTAYAVTSVSVLRLEPGWNAFERCNYGEAYGEGRTRSPRFKVSWSRVSRLIVFRNTFRARRERKRERGKNKEREKETFLLRSLLLDPREPTFFFSDFQSS